MGAIDPCFAGLVPTNVVTGRLVPGGARLSPRRLCRAIEFMLAHVAEDVSVERIAVAASLSVFHFSRAFRNTTGLSPYQYLLHCRVARVRELLLNGDLSLAEVAAQAGFADQSHMTNLFKRLAGTTPLRYRNQQVAAAMNCATLEEGAEDCGRAIPVRGTS